MTGGKGADLLLGGGGADTCLFAMDGGGDDVVNGGPGHSDVAAGNPRDRLISVAVDFPFCYVPPVFG